MSMNWGDKIPDSLATDGSSQNRIYCKYNSADILKIKWFYSLPAFDKSLSTYFFAAVCLSVYIYIR